MLVPDYIGLKLYHINRVSGKAMHGYVSVCNIEKLVKFIQLKVYVYSPDIPSRFSRLYIKYPQVLELTLSQSNLPGVNAAPFSAAEATWYLLLLGGQRHCGFKACPKLLHVTGAAGIESQTPRSWGQSLNHLAMCSNASAF